MKPSITLILLIFAFKFSFAQDFKPGWYIVEKGAEYIVFSPGYLDYQNNKGKTPKINELILSPGEVVFIWEKSKELYIGNEWFGRIVLFDNIDKLTPVTAGGKIAYLGKDVEDLNGKVASAGSSVWITDYNTANKTVTILLNEGKKVTIPADDVTILANYIQSSINSEYKVKTAD